MEDNKNITKQNVEDWSVNVQEDGSVKVNQTIKTEYTQSYRDFLTDYRQMQKNLEKAKEVISDDYKKKVEADIKEMQDEIEKLKPYMDESEKKAVEYNKKQQLEQQLNKVKEELGKNMSDINTSYMSAVWDNIRENEEQLLEKLTDEEKQKFQKIKLRKVHADKLNKRAGKKKQ